MARADKKDVTARTGRVAERVQRILAKLLVGGALRDERVRDVVITSVRMTPDLLDARINIRTLSPVAPDEVVDVMNKAAPRLRKLLGNELSQRVVPRLQFFWDVGIDNRVRIETLLQEAADVTRARTQVLSPEEVNLREWLDPSKPLLVTCHKKPDADALGTALGLHLTLAAEGYDSTLYVPGPISQKLLFLLREVEDWKDKAPSGAFQATFVCDTAVKMLLPEDLFSIETGLLISVDHHQTHDDIFDAVFRDSHAAASGEVVARIFEASNLDIAEKAALPLLAALMSDTGGFRFARVGPSTLRLGASLLEKSHRNIEDVARALFEKLSRGAFELRQTMLNNVRYELDGALVVGVLKREDFERCKARDEEIEGLVDLLRQLEDARVACLVWERSPEFGGGIRINMRSTRDVDVSQIARTIGGGGHKHAAAATSTQPLEHTLQTVRDAVADALKG